MKYKLTIKQHLHTIAEGVIETKPDPDNTDSQMRHEEQSLMGQLFEIEQAINAHTQFRAHFNLID